MSDKKTDALERHQRLLEEMEHLTDQKKIERARTSFVHFCEYVIKDESLGTKIKLAELQKTWIRHIAFCKKHKLNCLILAPMASGKCVTSDTDFITLHYGTQKARYLKEGDKVLSFNEETKEYVWKAVTAIEEQPPKECIEVAFESGRTITTTEDHPFYTKDGWCEAQDLRPKRDKVLVASDWQRPYYQTGVKSEQDAYALGVLRALFDAPGYPRPTENIELIAEACKENGLGALDKVMYRTSQSYRLEMLTALREAIGIEYGDMFNVLMNSDISLRRYFVAGIFDTTGRFENRGKKMTVYTRYHRQAMIFQYLLSSIGIETKLCKQSVIEDDEITQNYKLSVLDRSKNDFTKLPSMTWELKRSLNLRPNPGNQPYDTVVSVTNAGKQSTLAIEVEDTHTHVTNGLVTHNTQIIGVALPLFYLGRDPSTRIKLVCLSDESAKERLGSIRTYIEEDEDYHKVFPDLKPDTRQEWTRHKLYVERPTISKDASLDAKGVISSGIGGRADLLLVDDIFDQRTAVAQPSTRENIISTFKQVWLSRVEPWGNTVVICTRWHEMDLAGHVMSDPVMMTQYGLLIQRVSDDMKRLECEVRIPDHLVEDYENGSDEYRRID